MARTFFALKREQLASSVHFAFDNKAVAKTGKLLSLEQQLISSFLISPIPPPP
jgi:hypothetical protein